MVRTLSAAAVCVVGSAAAAQLATFRGLGVVGQTGGMVPPNSEAFAVSGDGSIVAGRVWTWDGFHGTEVALLARWTPGAGWVVGGLGWIDAISADGSTLGGVSFLGLTLTTPYVERGGVTIGTGLMNGEFFALSGDGGVAAGQVGMGAVRWTDAGGAQVLGHIPGFGTGQVSARGVTADGSIVVGVDHSATTSQAFKWSAATGMVGLGFAPGASYSTAAGVSADGRVIVGTSGSQGFILTPWRGMESLPLLSGYTGGSAFAVSGDGSVIVGQNTAIGQSPPIAYYWDRARGRRDLKAFLISLGATGLYNWVLSTAVAISPDGSVIVGNGVNPLGQNEAWMARIPAWCYANCDGSTVAPVINANDFVCFLNRFAAGDPYANCDWSASTPAMNVLDFVCFLNQFAAGCP